VDKPPCSVALPVTDRQLDGPREDVHGKHHGPRRTCLTRSQALNRSEEGG
jgi:hypothetical protein